MAFENMTDSDVVDYIRPDRASGGNAAAQAEMTRRLLIAIRGLNRQSSRQASLMIWLTVAIAVLTVFIAILTAAMAWR